MNVRSQIKTLEQKYLETTSKFQQQVEIQQLEQQKLDLEEQINEMRVCLSVQQESFQLQNENLQKDLDDKTFLLSQKDEEIRSLQNKVRDLENSHKMEK